MNTDRYEAIEKRIEEGDVIVDFIGYTNRDKAKVIGFNLDIGATFIDAYSLDRYLLCTHGKLSSWSKDKHLEKSSYKRYLEMMDLLLSGIEEGLVNWNEIRTKVFGPQSFLQAPASSETCSFNQ